MRNIKILFSVCLALALLAACANTPKDNAPAEKASDTAVNAASAIPAAAINDSEYIYCVGSVSKMYVTAAVMQLADEGKIDIEKPVTEYIPEFRMADERYKDITVRMLMDHTSGIMGTSWKNGILYNDNDQYGHDHLIEYLSTQRLKADPGKFAAYCNDGFCMLEIIVENVSGMTYTDYIKKNISGRIGLESTGTAIDMFGNEAMVPSVTAGNMRLDTEYDMGLGTGGVYSTASDNALFGTAFFTGDNTLISEDAKNAMAVRWSDNEYCDGSGLGWDYAGMGRYENSGVKVVGKGGDVDMDHAWLWCAPDEQISVSVLTNGGTSSYNALVASALLDTALAEKGINIQDTGTDCETVARIPEEYRKYAGWYIVNIMGLGDTIYNITFPENRYMHVEETDHRRTTRTDYLLTTDGDFAELAYEVNESGFDTRLAAGYSRLSFEETTDGTFLRMKGAMVCPGLGQYDINSYVGQKIEENDIVSDGLIDEYRELAGKSLLLYGEKYSSANYDSFGIARIYMIDKLKGYVFLNARGIDFVMKITDRDHLTSFKSIPSSSSRDMMDITVERDGSGIVSLQGSNSLSFIPEDRAPVFDASVKSVTISGDAAWYNISDSIANCSVTVTRPENSAVYVYNKYGEVIYTTHNKDARPQIPMPKGGKVLFLGQLGDSFEIRAQ